MRTLAPCRARLILPLVGAVFVSLLATAAAQVPVARLATGEWAPYVGRELEGHGVCARVVTAVLQEMGLSPELVFLPWPQAIDEAERSASDNDLRGTFPYVRAAERERLFYFSQPIFTAEVVIFYSAVHHPELADLTDVEQLAGLVALSSEGYAHPPELERVMEDVQTEPNEFRAFERLIEDGSVHYLPAARLVGQSMLDENFGVRGLDVQTVPALSWQRELHLMASRRNPRSWDFIQDFDASLARLEHSGALDRLVRAGQAPGAEAAIVVLVAAPGQSIVARDPEVPDRRVALPAGARATVVHWGAAYRNGTTRPIEDSDRLCRVRLLDGPARGRVLDVDGRHLELRPEGAR
jgi:polar amino acid transport system substrate-binding protein